MRVVLATVIALLALNFADEHFNSGTYVQAMMGMIDHIRQAIGL